jgi:hypothetical protein
MSSFVELSSGSLDRFVSSFISRSVSTVQLITSYNKRHINQLGWANPGAGAGSPPNAARPSLPREGYPPGIKALLTGALPAAEVVAGAFPPPEALARSFLKKGGSIGAMNQEQARKLKGLIIETALLVEEMEVNAAGRRFLGLAVELMSIAEEQGRLERPGSGVEVEQ